MIPKIQNSQRFTDDYKNYQERIIKISDPIAQKELINLLVQLKEQVSYIDRSHESMFITGRINSEVSDLRSNLMTIKKSLDQKLTHWERIKQN
jgi:hypothetical protein